MSADKHKARDRAYAWLRNELHYRNWYSNHTTNRIIFTGPPSPEMHWFTRRGLSRIIRDRHSGVRCKRNIFLDEAMRR